MLGFGNKLQGFGVPETQCKLEQSGSVRDKTIAAARVGICYQQSILDS